MRIVFMGSAELSCSSLDALMAMRDCDVVGIVTQPDRPSGRGRRLGSSAVRRHLAARSGLPPILAPDNVNSPESIAQLHALRPDLIVVVAFGQLLKRALLDVPPAGCLNVHASLLPKYRGAAPIQWAIANGERLTGVTTMFIDEGMDTGDIVLQSTVVVGPEDTAGLLHDRLAVAGADLLVRTIREILAGGATRRRQDHAAASYAPKLSHEDGRIGWRSDAVAIHNRVRAFNPWPCCFCGVPVSSGEPLKVLRTRVEQLPGGTSAGKVIAWNGDGPLVACGIGGLRLLEVQPAGRKAMSGQAYLCGHGPFESFE